MTTSSGVRPDGDGGLRELAGREASNGVREIPDATVSRLPEYLHALHSMDESGEDTVSSESLAAAAGVNSAKLRKDLSHLGSYGIRGVGYDIALLTTQISDVLGLRRHRRVALVGIGHLGQALAGYGGFGTRGFEIAALFDVSPERVGTELFGLPVRHLDDLTAVVSASGISIAMIATPPAAAQRVADSLVEAGVTSILNFAPCVLNVPGNVDVRKVDLAVELQILSFHEHRKAQSGARPKEAA
ncbi:MAG: redox-sensing transcriptional repressor Rex [Stackebrandtia sp.]